jgi:hypothetical protein
MGLLGRTLASLLPLHTAVVGDAIEPRLAACSSLFLDSSWSVRKPFRPETALRWLFTRSALSLGHPRLVRVLLRLDVATTQYSP